MTKALVISNMGPGDITFEHDLGVWNVTRALRDCRNGKHKRYWDRVEDVYKGSAAIEFDEAKVVALLEVAEFEPLIAVVENGAIWLIDGRHRLEVMHRRGDEKFIWYVIEEADAAHYHVLYNGERHPPWKPTLSAKRLGVQP